MIFKGCLHLPDSPVVCYRIAALFFRGPMIAKAVMQTTNNRPAPSATDSSERQLTVSDDLIENLVKLFKLLSDETRLRILYYLTQRSELHVRALCELLGESQPAVSHHLALLRVAGLIDRRREGKHNYYGLKTRQFSTLLDMLFESMPEGSRRIRFEDYMLTHVPA
jgi:ArsR family transcriptional regulator, arsenate/arsenite/antimonite-responsive transcriptional repressor